MDLSIKKDSVFNRFALEWLRNPCEQALLKRLEESRYKTCVP